MGNNPSRCWARKPSPVKLACTWLNSWIAPLKWVGPFMCLMLSMCLTALLDQASNSFEPGVCGYSLDTESVSAQQAPPCSSNSPSLAQLTGAHTAGLKISVWIFGLGRQPGLHDPPVLPNFCRSDCRISAFDFKYIFFLVRTVLNIWTEYIFFNGWTNFWSSVLIHHRD